MLERDIGKDPTAQYDDRLEERKQVCLQVECRHEKRRGAEQVGLQPRETERHGQQQSRDTDTKRQHVDDAVVAQCGLLADVITAETQRREKSQKCPHISKTGTKVQ